MNAKQEQKFVLGLVDQIMAVIAGTEMAQAHTVVSLSMAALIISITDSEQKRTSAHSAFCKQVADLLTPEWVEYIKYCTTKITLATPERQQ